MNDWILIRHAHRDTVDPAMDNGLSLKGQKQVKILVEALLPILKEYQLIKLVSSPKIRCQETISSLGKALGVPVRIDADLIEGLRGESLSELKNRIMRFFNNNRLSTKKSLVICCSHGDWLPVAHEMLTGTLQSFKKSEWFLIKHND